MDINEISTMFALFGDMVVGEALAAAEQFNAKARAGGWGGFCDPHLAFEYPGLCSVLTLWREKTGTRRVPARGDFSLRCLKNVLGDVAIYERVPAPSGRPRYRVRLMGTYFAETMGDLTGKFLDESVPGHFLPRWYAALDAAFDAGGPLRFVARSETANKAYLVAEYFQAPMTDETGETSLVLAASHFGPNFANSG
jgi:hypothetical protein